MKDETRRNWRATALIPHDDHYTVEIEVDGVRRDSGEVPSSFGDFGLSRAERGILHRGMTAGGADRKPRA